ncbi:nucleotide exchange factor GrpE [Roseovarius salis]|uniref:nucleotide exchange factor GrpE n=1 Tax=Roseovarius salis TaxID=3376063 RepID=UPI0037C7CB6C
MAERDEDRFLDDIAEAETEEQAPMTEDVPEQDAEAEQLRAERDALQDKFMRALAEAENARKRAQKDRMEAEHYGGSKLARDMLPVYDNLQRALGAVTDEQKEVAGPLIEGVELTMRELLKVFEKHGIKIIDPQVGDRFDPQQHEAMFEAPLPGTNAGDIIQVSAQGFMLHDRMLRPAQVGVSSYQG